MKQMKYLIIVISVLCICSRENKSENLVNFSHLKNLTESIELGNKECDIIHIYSEFPDYNWVDAANEGIACVDDVARAAIVYLRFFELTGTDSVLNCAKKLLNFVLYMQSENGDFFNFIQNNLEINKTGLTSRKSFGFWAARGYWALGFGYKVFRTIDIEFADQLKTAFLKCKISLNNSLENYQKFITVYDQRYPQWLILKTGSDATSALLLGMAAFLQAEPDHQLVKYAIQLAEGIMEMQLQSGQFKEGAFLSWIDTWHAWGNAQTEALASLGKELKNPLLINAAENEAQHYYVNLLLDGMIAEWQLADSSNIKVFPQISYAIRCMSLGLLRLFDATDKKDYAILAGLAASWLSGNNAAGIRMYNPQSGRCFDGINDSTEVNFNSGAESTIEALYTIIEISQNSLAKKYLEFKSVRVETIMDENHRLEQKKRIFENKEGERITLTMDYANKIFRIE